MKSSPRIGYENNFLKHNNLFYGILIGADFCAEHEYRIFYLEFDEAIKLAQTGVVKQDDDYTISPS